LCSELNAEARSEAKELAMTRNAARSRIAARLFFSLALSACGSNGASGPASGASSSSHKAPNGGSGGGAASSPSGGGAGRSVNQPATGSGVLSALIDGMAWTAASSNASARTEVKIPGGYTLHGTDSARASSLTLSFYYIDSPGTYPFGVTGAVVGAYASYSDVSGATWHTALKGAEGKLIVTDLTPKRIAGTFELALTAYPGTKATGMHAVTAGKFDMPLTAAATPIGADQGRVLRGELKGATFNAASIVVTQLASGFSFNAINDDFNVGFSFADVSAPGTYDLSFATPVRTIVAIAGSKGDPKTNCCWGASSSDSGSLTLTTLSPDRFVGSFEVTLQPQASSAATAPLVIKSGTFDIGRRDP
jgi:hypothetical protein